MTLDAALALQKVRILALLFLMNQMPMMRVTLVAPVLTQQAQPVPVRAAAPPR